MKADDEKFTPPKRGGGHTDALEHGMPSDSRSEGAGKANEGVGVKPSSSPTELERADYPEPGEGVSGGGGTNHRVLPTPSTEASGPIGRRGIGNAKGFIGSGQNTSGKFRGTMGDGEVEPKSKGTMGS